MPPKSSEYITYNTQREVTVKSNEYLLRNEPVVNPAKDLRYSALEKGLQF